MCVGVYTTNTGNSVLFFTGNLWGSSSFFFFFRKLHLWGGSFCSHVVCLSPPLLETAIFHNHQSLISLRLPWCEAAGGPDGVRSVTSTDSLPIRQFPFCHPHTHWSRKHCRLSQARSPALGSARRPSNTRETKGVSVPSVLLQSLSLQHPPEDCQSISPYFDKGFVVCQWSK